MDGDRLHASAQRSREAWWRLGLAIQSITPSAAARFTLVVVGVAVVAWLMWSAWFSLLPFQVGLVVAYVTLPVVNSLDRVMPRFAAVMLTLILQLLAALLFVGGLMVPLVEQLSALVVSLPSVVELRELVLHVRSWIGTLPEPTQTLIMDGIGQMEVTVRANALPYAQEVLTIAIASSLSLVSAIGFALGFLAVPAFLNSVMVDQRLAVRAINRGLPAGVRADFWAVVRILDRTMSSYLRGQLFRAFIFGVAVAGALTLFDDLGFTGVRYPAPLGMLAGVTYLIPTIGWVIGAVPAVLLGLLQSRETGLAMLALFTGLAFLETNLLAPRISSRSIDVHPAILMTMLVVISQFGIIWVLIAAPLLVIARDLFRYVYGRLGDPPARAGLLPGERIPAQPRPRVLRRYGARAPEVSSYGR